MKDFTSCIDNFDNALKKDSSYVDSYYMRAVAYSSDLCQLQDINKAILDLKKYLEFNPNDNAANKLLKALNQI
jgi:Tfp pilus assembly protein PilF